METPTNNSRSNGENGQVIITFYGHPYPVPFSYLQVERTVNGVIPSNGAVVFDNVLSSGGRQIGYSEATGEIIFNQAGYYHAEWFIATEFGLATDGSNFALISSENDIEPTGSSHVRVSPTVGFAIIEVMTPGKTIRLINKSDDSLTLSSVVKAKAALAVFVLPG